MKKTSTQTFIALQQAFMPIAKGGEALWKLLFNKAQTGVVLKTVPLMLLVLVAATKFTYAQQGNTVNISGTVVDDADGSPLPSVSITDANKRVLGVTDAAGKFRFNVIRNAEVRFSFIGYASQTKTFTANANVTVRMLVESSKMNEVVVTALGIKREAKALPYATTTVKGEDLTNALSQNWSDALSGKVAGLNLIRSGSGPGGSNKIILRGENNLTDNNEALIVVDGVIVSSGSGARRANGARNGAGQEAVYGTGADNMPVDYGSSVNDINPEDIESVTVLKGAAAAALYGQRGANGAIMITTKAGNPKKKGFGVTLNSNYSFEKVNRWPDMQFEYGQGLGGAAYYSYEGSPDGASTSGTSSAYGPKFNGQMFYQYDPVTQGQGKVRTPWVAYPNKIRQYFDTGTNRTNTITVDGGTDRTNARLSITNLANSWILPNTGYNRNTVALSVNSKVNDKLTISSKVNYTNNQSDNLPGAGYGNQSPMYWFIFWQPNADIDWLKNYWQLNQVGRKIEYPFSSFPENPYAIAYEFINARNRNSVTGNVMANYAITKELNLQLRTSLDMAYDQREQKRPYDAGSKLPKGSYRYQNINTQEVSGDFLLRYTKKFLTDFQLTATAGGSMMANRYNKDELRADSLTNPGQYFISNAAGPLTVYPDKTKRNLNSYYGLLSLSYKNYLYFDGTYRKDFSSTLATPLRTNKAGFPFGSAGLSFVLTDFDGFKLPKEVNYAKVRLSVGLAGSGGDVPYYTSYNYALSGGGLFPGGGSQNPTLLPNFNLEPYLTATWEAGAEARLFGDRLGFDVTLYSGNSRNQILTRVIDAASGWTNAVINLGLVKNKGIEIALNGTPLKAGKFKWDANFTFSANRNKIAELGDSSVVLRTGVIASGQIVAKVGGSIGDLYGIGYQRAPDGQIIYDGTTGFAKLTSEVKPLGNTTPKFRGSVGSGFTYRSIRLNVLFDAQFGAVAHSLTNYKMVEQGKLKSTLPGRYSGIIGNGVVQNPDGTFRPNDVLTYDIDKYYQAAMGAENAEGSTFSTDFIKFREASLNYALPAKLLSRVGIQRATVGVYGRNLFIWSPWPAFDPEFGTLSGTDIVTGFEIAQFPSTRTFGASLIIGF